MDEVFAAGLNRRYAKTQISRSKGAIRCKLVVMLWNLDRVLRSLSKDCRHHRATCG